MKIIPGNIFTAFVRAEMLDLVQSTCNYEASGDQIVLVDTDQLDNTSDTSGKVGELAEEIQKEVANHHQSLGAELSNSGQWHGYSGLILLRS